MKSVLVCLAVVVFAAGVAVRAQAEDRIGIYSDVAGTTCSLVAGLSTSAVIIHTSSSGTIGSTFEISALNAPGSSILALDSAYQTVCCCPPCPFMYGGCRQSVVVGTLIALLQSGYIEVVSAMGAGCNEIENPTIGGRAYIGETGECLPLATEASTWGKVKSLYR